MTQGWITPQWLSVDWRTGGTVAVQSKKAEHLRIRGPVIQPQSSANGLAVPYRILGTSLCSKESANPKSWYQQKMYPPKRLSVCVCFCTFTSVHQTFGGTAHIKVFFFRELAHMPGVWKYCHRPYVRFAAFLTSVKEVLPAAKILHHWIKPYSLSFSHLECP